MTANSSSDLYWRQAWDDAQPSLREWKGSSATKKAGIKQRVIRVGQLDAELLDEELVQTLQEPLNKAFALIYPSLRSSWEAELTLLVRLILYKFSLWDMGASYGAKLQDLRYHVRDVSGKATSPSDIPRRTLATHAALTVIVPYLHARLRSHALSHAWPDTPSADRRRKAWNIFTRTESVHALLALINFVAFMSNGRYRTLTDRLLSMQLVPSRRLINREVSYEFMNRQMVWHAFTEFLLFVLPLINARTVRRIINRISSRLRTWNWPFFRESDTPTHVTKQAAVKRGKYFSLSPEQCAICAQNSSFGLSTVSQGQSLFGPIPDSTSAAGSGEEYSSIYEAPAHPIATPYQTSCGHSYCYYCISERLIKAADDGDDEWECLRCMEVVRNCERVTTSGKADGDDGEVSDEWVSDNDNLTFSSGVSLESSYMSD